jgi:uncharacterized membrane protein (UPF0127 family)
MKVPGIARGVRLMVSGLCLGLCLFFPNHVLAAKACLHGHCVQIEVVSRDLDMRRGLQHRDGLGKNQGMLFVFDKEDIRSFWMKDMKFPIDIVWLNAKKEIISIYGSVPACAKEPCQVYEPQVKAQYVLEVVSGYALRHQWKIGDQFQFKGVSSK